MNKHRNKIEKFIIILKSVELIHLTEYFVRSKFKESYDYLIAQERFEECAELRKIEKSYNKKIVNKKIEKSVTF